MQAVILAGGQGRRLQPLTANRPKPSVPLVDRPLLAYTLDWVAQHGLRDVLLCSDGSPEVLEDIGDGAEYGVRITEVREPEPQGGVAALRAAADHLEDRFVVVNGAVLTDLDLTQQIAAHERTGARATLGLVAAEDGDCTTVELDEDRRILAPRKGEQQENGTGLAMTGVHVLERDVLRAIPSKRSPAWRRWSGPGFYGFAHADAYWLHIRQLEQYLQATTDVLSGRLHTGLTDRLAAGPVHPRATVGSGARVAADAWVEAGAMIAANARVLSGSVVCSDAVVGRNAVVERSVLMPDAYVGADAYLCNAVVGLRATVGIGVRVIDAVVQDGSLIQPT